MRTLDDDTAVGSDVRPHGARRRMATRTPDGYEWFLLFVLAVTVLAWLLIGLGPGA